MAEAAVPAGPMSSGPGGRHRLDRRRWQLVDRQKIAPEAKLSWRSARVRGCLAAAATSLLAVSAGCDDGVGPASEHWSRNLAKWEAAGPTDYDYEYQRTCFCPPELTRAVRLEVRDGEVVAASFLDTEEAVPDTALARYPAIEDLFEEVRQAIEGSADSVFVAYDPKLGYPTEAFIDFARTAIDEEQGFTATSLRPATGPPATR